VDQQQHAHNRFRLVSSYIRLHEKEGLKEWNSELFVFNVVSRVNSKVRQQTFRQYIVPFLYNVHTQKRKVKIKLPTLKSNPSIQLSY